MPDMDKKLLSGGGDFYQGDAARIEVRNFSSDVDDKLKKDGWKGEAVCYIGLYLSADNTRVDRGNFMVKGKLTDESLRIEANKIWTEADDSVVLVLNFPKAEVFTFNESGLSSDIVRQEDIQHGFYLISGETAPQVILETDYEELGVGKFCMRMMCTVSKSSSARTGVLIKYTLYMYPEGKSEMLASYELAQSPAWPAMRITEGEMPLLLKPTAPWGCPALPLVLPGTPFEQLPVVPAMEELRRCIATIMRKVTIPEIGRTGATLAAKWRRLANNPEEMASKTVGTTWPAPSEAPAVHGKSRNNL